MGASPGKSYFPVDRIFQTCNDRTEMDGGIGVSWKKKGEDRNSLHPHFFDLPVKSGEKTGFPVGSPLQSEIPAAFSRGRPKKPRTAKTIRLPATVTQKQRKSKEKIHFF